MLVVDEIFFPFLEGSTDIFQLTYQMTRTSRTAREFQDETARLSMDSQAINTLVRKLIPK